LELPDPKHHKLMAQRHSIMSQAGRCEEFLHTYLPMKMEQTQCSKRRHIKFRHQGITQKKAYSIQNTAEVWNQEYLHVVTCHFKAIILISILH